MSANDHHPTSTYVDPIDAPIEAASAMPAATDSVDPWREPVRGGAAYPALAALPGSSRCGRSWTGARPRRRSRELTRRRIIDASVGSATYVLAASDWMLGPKGAVHSGVLAVLADGALWAAVVSALPARVACSTAELSMTFLGPPTSAGGDLTARGRVVHEDAETALVEVRVRDSSDRRVAHGASRCSVFAPIDESIRLHAPRQSRAAAETKPESRS